VKLKLVNMIGQTVMTEEVKVTQEIEKFVMDASTLESGIYYVVAESTGSREVRKVTIMTDH